MKFSFRRPKIGNLDKYLQNKEYDTALAAVAAELKRNPRQFNLLLRQAEILGLAGDRDRAIKVYRELAEKYARDGFYAKAIALYKKVLKLDPELEEVHAELARLIDEDQRADLPLEERLQADSSNASVRSEDDGDEKVGDDDEDRDQQIKELNASALFASFRQDALEDILTSTALRSYDEGDIIVTEGEQGSSLFLIVSGEVKVFTRGERGEHLPLAELGAGDFFGEVSLLTGRPRTATITAKTPVIAIELDKGNIDRIAGDHPEVRKVLENFYTERAQRTVEAVIRRMREEGE